MSFIRAAAALAVLAVLLAASRPALAQAPDNAPVLSILDEVRAGILAHDVRFAGGREPGADLNAELLFVSPVPVAWGNTLPDWLAWVIRPRPNLGGDWNTAGATDQAYLGLSWTAPLLPRVLSRSDAITLDLGVGPAFNNGHLDETDPDRKALGAHVLIHGTAELGWHLTPHLGVFVLFEHSSNGHLAKYNQSLNELGARIGWRF